MPGPKHGASSGKRRPGPRPIIVGHTKEGEPITKSRTPNRKQEKRLNRRLADFDAMVPGTIKVDGSFHRPGSQNRKR